MADFCKACWLQMNPEYSPEQIEENELPEDNEFCERCCKVGKVVSRIYPKQAITDKSVGIKNKPLGAAKEKVTMDKNLVELEGNVTKDVELKSDGKYCFVTVAVGRTKSGGTDFISVKAFGDTAKQCAGSLKKGDRVAIEGRMASSSFVPKDKTEKEKEYRTDVVIETIRKLPKNGGDGAGFIDDTAAASEPA